MEATREEMVMIHDELLAKIDGYIKNVVKMVGRNNKAELGILNALRAIVEVHHPVPFKRTGNYLELPSLMCFECSHSKDPKYWVIYPCPTIQAIEKELA
jgi:hypothetical protein